MHRSSVRMITWGLRLIYIIIAFWWPAILRDPIYTPRYARLTGQELHLPRNVSSEEDDAQALAIFWNWENRALVSTHWFLGPFIGIRASEGQMQTFIVLFLFWVLGSVLLSRWNLHTSSPGASPRQRGFTAWFSTPIWQWFIRRP